MAWFHVWYEEKGGRIIEVHEKLPSMSSPLERREAFALAKEARERRPVGEWSSNAFLVWIEPLGIDAGPQNFGCFAGTAVREDLFRDRFGMIVSGNDASAGKRDPVHNPDLTAEQ